MTRVVLVVPTGRRAGLTSTCLGLVHALEQARIGVGFGLPIGQSGAGDHSVDLIRLTSPLRPPSPIPPRRAAELLGQGRLDDLMDDVVALTGAIVDCDVLVLEGLVPAAEHVWSTRVNLAMATALDADVLLVADAADAAGSVGSEGDEGRSADRRADLSADRSAELLADAVAVAADAYRAGDRVHVIGCVLNRVPAGTDTSRASAALGRHGIALVGAVPYRPELARPRVADVVRELGARVLVRGDQSRRVAEVVVCAQAVPGLLPLLRDGRLLLVPGDRHEVVMAACLAESNGVRLAGLLLTAGVEPDPRVTRLTAAAGATGLPILVVDELTYPTAVRLHDLAPDVPADDGERAAAVARTFAASLDPGWVAALPAAGRPDRLTPAAFRSGLVAAARRADARIVLPEGAEPRIVRAAIRCAERGIARCLLLANPLELTATLAGLGLALPAGVEAVDPAEIAGRYVDRLVALRAHKGMTRALAVQRLTDPITVGTMLLAAGEVDGLVAGVVHTTAATVRPALELIGVAAGSRLVSSVFFMCLPGEVVVYGDCAINPDPSAADLADIAVQSADSAAMVGIEPRVAMISFSTGTSGSGVDVDTVATATALVALARPDLAIDGPLQYDAAAVASVARSKRPGSPVAGRATVFVFPDLNTGNTTYKAVQRSADVVSVGPMLQGLARPVNDLSRGAGVEDVVYTIALTAVQAGRVALDASARPGAGPSAGLASGAGPEPMAV